MTEPSLASRIAAAATAAEGVAVAAVVGVGAELLAPGTGLLAFGLACYLPLVIDRIRRRP